MVAFEGNDSNQNLWFEPYYGSTLEPAVQNSARIGYTPAEIDWTPSTGTYAGQETIFAAFNSQNGQAQLFNGLQPVSYRAVFSMYGGGAVKFAALSSRPTTAANCADST